MTEEDAKRWTAMGYLLIGCTTWLLTVPYLLWFAGVIG